MMSGMFFSGFSVYFNTYLAWSAEAYTGRG